VYENRRQKLLTRRRFIRRVTLHLIFSACAIAVSLFAGVAGYHYLDDLPWIDALVNASMILGGMGPVDPLKGNAAKLFASSYALFSGLVFIAIAGVLFAPFFHRLMHKLHFDAEGERKK
jgi:hypothetical protein